MYIVYGFPWCFMCGTWLRISSRYFFFLIFTLKNEEAQNAIPISFFFFSKGGGHKFTEFACLFCVSCLINCTICVN